MQNSVEGRSIKCVQLSLTSAITSYLASPEKVVLWPISSKLNFVSTLCPKKMNDKETQLIQSLTYFARKKTHQFKAKLIKVSLLHQILNVSTTLILLDIQPQFYVITDFPQN